MSEPDLASLQARVKELTDRDQRWVDRLVYYRNLAIMHGAGPDEMLNDWDRALAARGIPMERDERDPEHQSADEVAEVKDWWEREEALEATSAALLEALEAAISSAHDNGFNLSHGGLHPTGYGAWRTCPSMLCEDARSAISQAESPEGGEK